MIDWAASVENRYEYDLVDSRDLDTVVGTLDGVVPGGKLTEGWRTDYRQSATITLDGCEVPLWCAVRIWHVASQDGTEERTALATLMPKPGQSTYKLGRATGSVDLYSSMWRMGSDLAFADYGVAAGTDAIQWFRDLVEAAGGTAYVPDALTIAPHTFGSSHIWECGDSRLTELNRCAECCGARVTVDGWGRVALEPYQSPSVIAASGVLSSEMLEPGVGIDPGDMCNRAVCSVEQDDTRYFAHADIPAAHPWSKERIGYVVAETVNAPTVEQGGDAQAAADKAVADKMADIAAASTTYSVTGLYSPALTPGRVVALDYRDAPGDGVQARCFISQREVTLDEKMETQYTLEAVDG